MRAVQGDPTTAGSTRQSPPLVAHQAPPPGALAEDRREGIECVSTMDETSFLDHLIAHGRVGRAIEVLAGAGQPLGPK